tara:strand:- start:1603 stop:1866 length:264 start_codon:yes stop_codon:yes gene_type:complete
MEIKLNGIKKRKATKVASRVKQFYTVNYGKGNMYLNFSFFNDGVGYASVASRVKHQSNKLGLHRHSGSNPGGGVSTFFIKLQDNSRK